MNLLVTGGCGFIGSNFIEHVINKKQIYKLVNVDCLSYAGSLDNTKKVYKNFSLHSRLKNFGTNKIDVIVIKHASMILTKDRSLLIKTLGGYVKKRTTRQIFF